MDMTDLDTPMTTDLNEFSNHDEEVTMNEENTAVAIQTDKPLQAVPTPSGVSPIVAMVASGQYTPETLQQMLDVQKDFENNEARKAYAEALSEFRKLAPTINKDRNVSYKNTQYSHASIGNTMDTVNPILGQCGLNLSWNTEQADGMVTVTAILQHRLGHTEKTTLFAPPDNTGQKNTIQAIKSTITYLQRATAFAILGLAEAFDDDGAGHSARPEALAAPEVITKEQSEELLALIDRIDGYNFGYKERWYKYNEKILDKTNHGCGLAILASNFDNAKNSFQEKLASVQVEAGETPDTEEATQEAAQ